MFVHAFVAAMAIARVVTFLIQAAIAHTHPARLGIAADHESKVPKTLCIYSAPCEASLLFVIIPSFLARDIATGDNAPLLFEP